MENSAPGNADECMEKDIAFARALYAALQAVDQQVFLTDFSTEDEVVVDGSFDLVAISRWLRSRGFIV